MFVCWKFPWITCNKLGLHTTVDFRQFVIKNILPPFVIAQNTLPAGSHTRCKTAHRPGLPHFVFLQVQNKIMCVCVCVCVI